MMPCESWPTRLAPTMWRMTSSASSFGVPAAMNKARPISSRRSAWTFGMVGSSLRGLFDVRCPHQPQRLGVVAHPGGGGGDEILVLGAELRRRDLDHQPVFDPELDDVEKRVVPLHAASERLGAPALPRADRLDRRGVERHRQEHVKRPGLRRRLVLAEDDLVVVGRDVERRPVRVDLDHVAVRPHGHKGAFERAERHAFSAHHLGENLGDVLRVARGDRDMVDHREPPGLRRRHRTPPAAAVVSSRMSIAIHRKGSGPPLVLLHCLGVDHRLWDIAAAGLERDFTLIGYDFPGHGESPLPGSGYGIAELSAALAAVFAREGIGRAHLGGISLGGLVAQHFAATHPELVDRLMLLDTTPRYTDEMRRMWVVRAEQARKQGVASLLDSLLPVWFTP